MRIYALRHESGVYYCRRGNKHLALWANKHGALVMKGSCLMPDEWKVVEFDAKEVKEEE